MNRFITEFFSPNDEWYVRDKEVFFHEENAVHSKICIVPVAGNKEVTITMIYSYNIFSFDLYTSLMFCNIRHRVQKGKDIIMFMVKENGLKGEVVDFEYDRNVYRNKETMNLVLNNVIKIPNEEILTLLVQQI